MNHEFLGPDDVVSSEQNLPVIGRSTFQSHELFDVIKRNLSNSSSLVDGVECQILRPGGEWRKGKVKLSLEFIPDANTENQ